MTYVEKLPLLERIRVYMGGTQAVMRYEEVATLRAERDRAVEALRQIVTLVSADSMKDVARAVLAEQEKEIVNPIDYGPDCPFSKSESSPQDDGQDT